jgi:hypothetical protein
MRAAAFTDLICPEGVSLVDYETPEPASSEAVVESPGHLEILSAHRRITALWSTHRRTTSVTVR